MTRPLVIGIAGGTGSGKTTVARKVAAGLPAGAVQIIEHDSYYRDRSDLSAEERAKLNYDHPDSLDNDMLVEPVAEQKDSLEFVLLVAHNFIKLESRAQAFESGRC